MSKNIIIGLVVLLIIIFIGGFYYFRNQNQKVLVPEFVSPPTLSVNPTLPLESTEVTTSSESTLVPESQLKEIVIRITDQGFKPNEITIKKGTEVTWVNESSASSWPASAVHPTHEVYPGSSIKKCGTPQQDKIFDSCRGLEKGEKWSFVFNEVGEWYYHDHLNPSKRGEVVVE